MSQQTLPPSGYVDVISDDEFKLLMTPAALSSEPPVPMRTLNSRTIEFGLSRFRDVVAPQNPDMNRHWFYHYVDPMNSSNLTAWAIFKYNTLYYLQTKHSACGHTTNSAICLGDGTMRVLDYIYNTAMSPETQR